MPKVYQQIASTFQAMRNCEASGNSEWIERHRDTILRIVKDRLPSGSGFDFGTVFVSESSKPDKLIFSAAFHHMNSAGYYAGWTAHTVTVTPSFDGFNLKVSGRNRNDIKDYIAETFHNALSADIPAE